MSDLQLIDAVKTGQLAKVDEALNAGADIQQQDEQGWTPLNWAAGRGSVEIVSLLLNRGADVFRTGRDQRTPYKVAVAAKHIDVARLLKKAEQAVNGASGDSTSRDYARVICSGNYGSSVIGVKRRSIARMRMEIPTNSLMTMLSSSSRISRLRSLSGPVKT